MQSILLCNIYFVGLNWYENLRINIASDFILYSLYLNTHTDKNTIAPSLISAVGDKKSAAVIRLVIISEIINTPVVI